MIIDFHTHTFPEAISAKVIRKLSMASATMPFTNGSMPELIQSMKSSGVDYSVNFPVMTSPEQVEKIHTSMLQTKDTLLSDGIISFGGLHPDYENYKSEIKRLRENGIKGIKLHPAYQNVDLNDPRMMRMIDVASAEDMIVLIHAGIDIGIYDHDYASVKHILQVVDEIAPPKFVLAHMGGWGCWDDVERDLAGANVYMDTAFSIGDIVPNAEAPHAPIRMQNLSTEQFVNIVRKHGTDKILFATDSPWAGQKEYIAELKAMPLTDAEKVQILGENAAKLLEM